MQNRPSTRTIFTRFLVSSVMLTSLSISSVAFAKSHNSHSDSTERKESTAVEQPLNTTKVSDFKVAMRSILSSQYKKKCSPAYVVRLSSETARTWFDQAVPGGGEGYEQFMKEMTPDDESTLAPLAIFVQDLEYPILMVYRKDSIPMYFDLNKFKLKEDLKITPDGCKEKCADFIAQELEKHSSKNLCYTVNEEDKTTPLGELEVGVGFNL